MARVVRFHKTGGPEVLQIEEIDVGSPGAGELRLHVHALGSTERNPNSAAGQRLLLVTGCGSCPLGGRDLRYDDGVILVGTALFRGTEVTDRSLWTRSEPASPHGLLRRSHATKSGPAFSPRRSALRQIAPGFWIDQGTSAAAPAASPAPAIRPVFDLDVVRCLLR